MRDQGRTLWQAVEVLDELLDRKPDSEKTEEEIRLEQARANAEAYEQLYAMMANVRLPG